MKAVVLAHERALTLEPFSTTRPRSLIPVLNVPVIGHLLRALAAADVPDAQITTGHLGEAVAAYVAGEDPAGLRIGTVTVESPDELARVLLEALRGSEEPLLILDGATYMEEGLLREVIQAGTSLLPAEGGAFGLGVNTNPLYHSSALLDARGALLGLQPVTLDRIKVQEQSPLPDILAGCMLVSPAASGRLSEILAARRPVTFAELAAACVAEGLPLAGARSTKQCITMDYPWEILGASFLGIRLTFDRPEPIRQFAPTAKVHPDAILKNTVIVGEGAIVESGAVLDDVILDAGCHIREHSYLMRTILGPGCRIGPTGYTHHTVLGPRCSVGFPGECPVAVGFGRNGFGHHCHAGMGVYGERAVLNAGAIVTANRGNPVKTKIQGRLMDTGWFNIGAFLGDGVRLNAQATVMPGRIIGARSVIGPGVIVYHDVPPDTLLVLKQELQETKIEPR